MYIKVLTLFPEMFAEVLSASILGRAAEKGILSVEVANIRDYSTNKHLKADDYPFGGGAGMVLMAQPVFDAVAASTPARKVYMSPRGKLLDEALIRSLAAEEELLILCGHYEGMDQRVLDYFDFEEVSIGDYVLTGGELPAMVLIDAVARMLPEALGNEQAHLEESIYSGLLEYPQYTRPAAFEYQGQTMEVPPVLAGGNHKEIHLWNYRESLALTMKVRPDLFRKYIQTVKPEDLTKEEKKILAECREAFELEDNESD